MKDFIFRHRRFIFPATALLISSCIFIIGAETALRYFEKKFYYGSNDLNHVIDGVLKEGGHLKKNFRGHLIDSFGNEILWVNNSDGFRNEKEFTRKPDKDIFRVLSLGDSFTAGYRIGQTKTFSYLMEKWINREFGEAEVMIAWTEEPRVALKYMMEFGHHYNPDMVFLGITLSNDITQVYGGKPGIKYYEGLHNREVADDCLRKRNLWEEIGWVTNFVYTRLRFIGLFYDQPRAVSSRHNAYKKPKLFDTHHALGFFMNPSPKVIEDAYRELFLKISELKKFLDDKNIDLVVSIFPQRFQIAPKDWDMMIHEYGLNQSCFDLSYPTKLFESFCDKRGINCIDGTNNFKQIYMEKKTDFYQPRGDTHWNELGNKAFFDSVTPLLREHLERNKNKFWRRLN